MDIPQDIIDSVIAAVGDDTRVLKQCALVSSSFLLPSRKQLFSRITLEGDQSCQGIHQLLIENTFVQSFVRTITLGSHRRSEYFEWVNGKSLLAILRLPFCCLEHFSIIMCRDYSLRAKRNWNSFSSQLKDALSNIIHSSTLKTLSLDSIIKVPITFFQHIDHITTLELTHISPIDFYDNNSSSLRATSKGVVPIATHPVIDQCVWRFGQAQMRTKIPTKPISFLPFMCRLRFLEVCIGLGTYWHDFNLLSFFMESICTSLTSSATLEHLTFSFRSLFKYFVWPTFYEKSRNAGVWRHLDSITTHPNSSRLQRVDINIHYHAEYASDKYEIEKAVFGDLPLLHTKGILFVEGVSGNQS